ncbi:MAG: DUF2007 domain-containing protein [Flavobacterium sp.]
MTYDNYNLINLLLSSIIIKNLILKVMVDFFRGSYFEAMNIKNLLENNDVDVFVLNENMAILEPWVVTAAGFNPVTLRVNEVNLEKAKSIMEEYWNQA